MTTSSSGSLLPNSPVVNLGNLYVYDMGLTYSSATVFIAGPGQCRDATDTTDIIMGGNLYVSPSNPSGAQGTNNPVSSSNAITVTTTVLGAGGLDVGTLADSTLYYVYAIGDSRGFNNGSALFSLNSTSPHLPLGYDNYRRIGSVATDGSGNLRPFTQVGTGLVRTMRYQVPTAPGSAATSGSTTYVSIGVLGTLVPSYNVDVIIGASLDPNAAGDALYLTQYGAITTTPANDFEAVMSASVEHVIQTNVLVCPQGNDVGAGVVLYATTSGSDTVAFVVMGYVDNL